MRTNLKLLMTTKVILFIFIFATFLSYGQDDWKPAKVLLKNGQTLKGLVKFPNTKLSYKKDKKGQKTNFDHTEVDKVFIGTSNPNNGYYEYIPISKNKMALYKLIRNGKAKLYTRLIKIHNINGFEDYSNVNKHKQTEISKEYYVIRENEVVATRILQKSDGISIANKANHESFKNYMKKYFSDCSDLVSFIEDNVYEDFDISQIVEDYNAICN